MIVATNNKGKLREIKSIFSDVELKSLKEAGVDVEVVEDQDTFYGNALKKAKEIFALTHQETISDDSGLCVDEFGDWPGVFTHRFLGEEATDEERNLAIYDRVKDFPLERRGARVVCNIVYYDGEKVVVGEGVIKGKITSPRGDNGFGFDAIFELDNGKTLAELSPEEKNAVSARYLALKDLKNKLDDKKRLVK